MIIHTHRLVGEFLYQSLPNAMKNKVDHYSFVMGNMKPDLVKKYKQMSHYYSDNKEGVLKIFEALMQEPLTKKEFSDLLGVFMHFLCDYTCIYHANDYIYEAHSLRLHMQYEIKFHLYAMKKLKTLKQVQVYDFQTMSEACSYIDKLIELTNIKDATPNISHDFNEMMTLLPSIFFYILKNRDPRLDLS